MASIVGQCSSNQYITIELEYSLASQDISANRSTISWTLWIIKSGASTSATWGNCSYSVGIGEDTRSGSSNVSVQNGGSTQLLSGTTIVNHDSEGNCSVSLSASISGKIIGNVSGTFVLPTIPRNSEMSITGNTIGSKIVLHISAASESFTHRVTYSFGSAGEWVVDGVKSGWYEWFPPESLAQQIPKSPSGDGKLTLYTCSNGSVIATKDYPIKLQIPDTMKPSLSGITLSAINENQEVNNWGIFLKGYSAIQIEANANGIYGSEIAAVWYSISGFESVKGGTSYQSPIINRAGELTISAQAVDSRGQSSNVVTKRISVEDYFNPVLSEVSLYRCNEGGDKASRGNYIYSRAVANCASAGGHNSYTMSITYRSVDGSHSGSEALLSGEAKVVGGAISYRMTYEATITLSDAIGKTAQAAVKIPTDEISFHIRKGGKGGGFGKYGEEDGVLDSDWELRVKGSDLVDFPVSSGASDEWFYIKFRSGLAMMWCNVTAEYSTASVLEKWVRYPFVLQAGVAAFGTLDGDGGNAGAALGWNVKVVPQGDNQHARVFVHNPSGSFGGADAVTVSVLVLGCYKQVAQTQIVGTATVGSVITAERLNEIEERNYSTDSKITAVKEALN